MDPELPDLAQGPGLHSLSPPYTKESLERLLQSEDLAESDRALVQEALEQHPDFRP